MSITLHMGRNAAVSCAGAAQFSPSTNVSGWRKWWSKVASFGGSRTAPPRLHDAKPVPLLPAESILRILAFADDRTKLRCQPVSQQMRNLSLCSLGEARRRQLEEVRAEATRMAAQVQTECLVIAMHKEPVFSKHQRAAQDILSRAVVANACAQPAHDTLCALREQMQQFACDDINSAYYELQSRSESRLREVIHGVSSGVRDECSRFMQELWHLGTAADEIALWRGHLNSSRKRHNDYLRHRLE